MEYRFGNSKKVDSQGETLPLTCPKCGKKGEFGVFSNSETRLKSTLPFVKKGNVYVLICPNCAGVFTVDAAKGKTFKKGEKLSIGNFDFKEPEKFEV